MNGRESKCCGRADGVLPNARGLLKLWLLAIKSYRERSAPWQISITGGEGVRQETANAAAPGARREKST